MTAATLVASSQISVQFCWKGVTGMIPARAFLASMEARGCGGDFPFLTRLPARRTLPHPPCANFPETWRLSDRHLPGAPVP